jgi:hypothetical protein
LNWPSCLALRDRCPLSYVWTIDEITYLEFNQITAPEFAFDREVEERPVSNVFLSIEEESNGPNLFLIERSLGPILAPKFQGTLFCAAGSNCEYVICFLLGRNGHGECPLSGTKNVWTVVLDWGAKQTGSFL